MMIIWSEDLLFVCSPQPWHSVENKQQYWDQLTGQVDEKKDMGCKGKVMDEQQQKEHFQSWETFWGRPGYGAPRDSAQKENLMKMLHYPENTVKNVRSLLCIFQ